MNKQIPINLHVIFSILSQEGQVNQLPLKLKTTGIFLSKMTIKASRIWRTILKTNQLP
jgi:hypothetical protein